VLFRSWGLVPSGPQLTLQAANGESKPGEFPTRASSAAPYGRRVDQDQDTQRVVIELHRGDGPMSGRFLVEGNEEPAVFAGWMELLALLESIRRPSGETATEHKEEEV